MSSSDTRLAGAASVTVLSRVAAKAAQVVFLVLAARLLSIGEFAEYSYAVALVATFVAVGDTGVALVGSREVSSGRLGMQAVYWSVLPAVLTAGLLAAAALVLVGQIDSGPGSAGLVLLLSAGYLAANALSNLSATMLRGVGRIGFEAGLQVAGALVVIVAGTTAAATGLGAEGVLAAFVAKEVAFSAAAHLALRSDAGPPRRPSGALLRRFARQAAMLALATTALALALRAPLVVLGNVGSAREVAVFSAPLRLAESAFMLFATLGFALLPSLTLLGAADPQRSRGISRAVLRATLAGSVALSVLAVPLAGPILELLFGSSFRAGAGAGSVLLAGIALYALVGVGWYAVVAGGRDGIAAATAGAGFVASAALSSVLVPDSGVVGAAWAFLGAFAVMTIVLARELWRPPSRD